MTTAYDAIAAVHRLEDAGLSRDAAEAITAGNLEIVDAVRDAALPDRDALAIKADLYRALWLQAAGIVGTITALVGIAVALASLVGTATQ